jgi:hypothetical protein
MNHTLMDGADNPAQNANLDSRPPWTGSLDRRPLNAQLFHA